MSQHLFKTLNRDVGKSIHQYDMISHNDRIVVGVSGGKDSLALLWILNERLARIPIKYKLFPVYIDPGFPNGFSKPLYEWVYKMGFDIRIVKTQNGILAHSSENLENPCFLCARLRRKKIFEIADELGCNKVAFGHHKDDIIETFFLNVFYSGTIGTMRPKQSVFKGKFSIIRPLAFVDEDRIQQFVLEKKFPQFINSCPYEKVSKRKQIKDLLNQLYRTNRKIKGNIFRSLSNINLDYML